MADNVTISVGIDTAKLRADAAIVKNQLREINKEVTAAAKAGDVSRIQAGAAQQDKLTRQYADLTRQIRNTTQATKEQTAANHNAARSFREMGVELGHFSHFAGLSLEGLRALRFGFAAATTAVFIRGIKDAITELNTLNSTAKGIRASPEALKAAQDGFKRTGQDAELAATMIGNFNKRWDEAALKQMAAGRGGTSGVAVYAGGRGNQPNIRDFEMALRGGRDKTADLAAIMADPERAILGRERNLKDRPGDLKLIAKGILEVKDATLQNALAEKIYGLTFEQAEKEIKKQSGFTEEMAKKILATKDATQQNALALKEYGLTFQQAESQIRKNATGEEPAAPAVAVAAQKQAQALQIYNDKTTDISNLWHDANATLGTIVILTAEASTHLSNWRKLLNAMATGQTAEIPALSTAPTPVTPAASAVIPSANALGGLIRGAGSGTSDSILARLSNGEFVIRAAAVRQIGVGFLRGLNGFAGGGLVGAVPRFAAGGLVGAGGRAVASFHFESGQSFRLSAPRDVVSAMVSEAHHQQMRSAGTKPSWYAGRPGGR